MPRNDGLIIVPRNDGLIIVPRNDELFKFPRNEELLQLCLYGRNKKIERHCEEERRSNPTINKRNQKGLLFHHHFYRKSIYINVLVTCWGDCFPEIIGAGCSSQ